MRVDRLRRCVLAAASGCLPCKVDNKHILLVCCGGVVVETSPELTSLEAADGELLVLVA